MKQGKIQATQIEIRCYSVKELATLYQLSGKTMKKLIAEFAPDIGKRVGHCYTPKQVRVIFDEIGIPGAINLN